MSDYVNDVDNDEDSDIDEHISNIVDNVDRVRVSVASTRLGREMLILDNGAEVSIFGNRKLMGELYEAAPIRIEGISDSAGHIDTNLCGHTGFNHSAWYTDRATANLLSFGECVDNCYRVEYNREKDSFGIEVTKGGAYYEFRRQPDTFFFFF